MNLHQRLEFSRKTKGVKLSELCQIAGVNYHAYYQQLKFSRPVPFETVDRIAQITEFPLSFFSSHETEKAGPAKIANIITQDIMEMINSTKTNKPGLLVSEFRDALHAGQFTEKGLGRLIDHCDKYEQISPEMTLPAPISFGRKSMARTKLKLHSPKAYFSAIQGFDKDLKNRSMIAHKRALHEDFHVEPEIIKTETGNGTVYGCYLRAAARVKCGTKIETVVMTEVVEDFSLLQGLA